MPISRAVGAVCALPLHRQLRPSRLCDRAAAAAGLRCGVYLRARAHDARHSEKVPCCRRNKMLCEHGAQNGLRPWRVPGLHLQNRKGRACVHLQRRPCVRRGCSLADLRVTLCGVAAAKPGDCRLRALSGLGRNFRALWICAGWAPSPARASRWRARPATRRTAVRDARGPHQLHWPAEPRCAPFHPARAARHERLWPRGHGKTWAAHIETREGGRAPAGRHWMWIYWN